MLKYISEIEKYLLSQYDVKVPDEDFVKFLYKSANLGKLFTVTAKEQFSPIIKKAFEQFINERIEDRLRSALQKEVKEVTEEKIPTETDQSTSEIVTTEEELEGFRIVRAITTRVVPPERVVYRDTKILHGDTAR